jgi:hypothetical protein
MALMTDLTLEEFRGKAPDQELAARLRKDAFLIWGSHTNPAEPESKSNARRKSRLSTLAAWFLRLSFRTSP